MGWFIDMDNNSEVEEETEQSKAWGVSVCLTPQPVQISGYTSLSGTGPSVFLLELPIYFMLKNTYRTKYTG